MLLNKNKIILFIFIMVFIGCNNKKHNLRLLPVLGPKKTDVQTGDTLYHSIFPFRLKSQYNTDITFDTIRGKIVVTDFFFATCRSICPEMSKHMAALQKKFADDDSLIFLSHTVNPMHDSVEVLRAYAEQYGAIRGKWYLLTGNRDSIYYLAKHSYLINALEDEEAEQGFLHSELFVLVDPDGHIRGYYDGTSDEEMRRLEKDIVLLKQEIRQIADKRKS
jgi:protein SCO1/2